MTGPAPRILRPGDVVGILGGGQLGRMLALAAANLGLKVHVFAPDGDAPACDVVARTTRAAYDDPDALDRFAGAVDVVTYEFENVPAPTAARLAARVPVLPDARALATTQDRLTEKTFVAGLGLATATFGAIDTDADLDAALAITGRPAVLKTRRFGYDGKGQVKIGADDDAVAARRAIGDQPAILEAFVPFTREVSVVLARAADGRVVAFDPAENEHRDHILHRSVVPAGIDEVAAADAIAIATRIADALGYVGVIGVEMFAVEEAGRTRLLVNEIAPRVHNSGHWTLGGATVSQFEQHIRAVAGWPLAAPRRFGRVEMINLVGAEIEEVPRWLATDGACVEVYGKAEARPGRKMGHVTRVMS